LLMAGFAGYLLYTTLGRTLGWRWLFIILFLGGGAGMMSAAGGTLLGAHDPVIVLSSVGTGLLTVGGLAWTLLIGKWRERLRPVPAAAAAPINAEGQGLKQTMTWYGQDANYRPAAVGSGLFLTVLLVAWFAAYSVFWLAGSRQPLNRVLVVTPPPVVVDWEVTRFGGHSSTVHAVAFDESGAHLATGDAKGRVKIWELETNNEVRTLAHDSNAKINALAFSHDGGRLAVAAGGREVQIWNTQTGDLVCKTDEHPGSVNTVVFSPDGSKIATGSTDDAVRTFDASTGNPLKSYFGCGKNIDSVAFLPDGERLLALGRNDQMIRIWDVNTVRQLKPLAAPHAWLTSFIVSPDGTRVAARDFSSTVYQWDTESGNRLGQISVGHATSAHTLAYSPDGNQLLSADWPNARLYDASTGRVVCTFSGHNGSLNSLAFHPDGDSIVTAGSDSTVRLWEVPENLRHSHSRSGRTNHAVPKHVHVPLHDLDLAVEPL
jgi:sugar lactone lactonase YvrE